MFPGDTHCHKRRNDLIPQSGGNLFWTNEEGTVWIKPVWEPWPANVQWTSEFNVVKRPYHYEFHWPYYMKPIGG